MLDKDDTEINPYRNKMSQENINNHNSFAPAFIVSNQHLLKDNPNMFVENFATRSVASLGTLGSPLPTFPEEKDYSFIETLGATFEEGSGALNAYRAFDNSMPWNTNLVFDPSFNPIQAIEEFPEDSPYRQYASEFAYARNKYHFDSIARNIDRLTQAREVLSSSSLVNQLLAGAVMGISDPTNILFANPIGATLKTGGSLLKVAGKLGAIAGAQEALNEGILQSVQDVRTIEDTAINIGGAVVLGSVLGGLSGMALKGMTKQKYDEIVQNIEKDLVVPENGAPDEFSSIASMPLTGRSVGAMQTPTTTMEQETLEGAFGLEKATKFINPALSLSQSPNIKVRQMAQDLITLPFTFRKNKDGIKTALSIEDNLKIYDAMYAGINKNYDDTFLEYKKASKGLPSMSTEEFGIRVYNALINDDIDPQGNSFVTKLAKQYRAQIIEPLKKNAISKKLLDENVQVTTAKSYFPRMYDTVKINLQLPEFRQILKTEFAKEYDTYVNNVGINRIKDFDRTSVTVRKLNAREASLKKLKNNYTTRKEKGLKVNETKYQNNVKKLEVDIARLKSKAERLRAKAQQRINDNIDLYYGRGSEAEKDLYLEQAVDNTVKNILGMNGLMDFSKPISSTGVFKNRVLNIPDEVLRDFLIRDPRFVLSSYIRQVAPQVEIVQKFGSMENFNQAFKDIDDEYLLLLKNAKTEKQRNKIRKARRAETKALQTMTELVKGTYQASSNPDGWIAKTMQTSRMLNYFTLMGGQTLASIPDIGTIVTHNGLINVLNVGFNAKLFNNKTFKRVVREGQYGGTAIELKLNNRVYTAAEIGNPYAYGTPFSRFLSNMSTTFSRVNLSVYWNQFWKEIASVLTQQRLLKLATRLNKGQAVRQSDLTYFASMGLDKDDLLAMGRSWEKSGSKEKGLFVAGVEQWDTNLARKFSASLNKAVDQQVVSKGFGDVPLFMNREAGKTIMQFQTFSFATHNRILLANLQRADANALSGFTTTVIMGMMVYYIRSLINGREVSDDPRQWVYEGLDRSGLLQVMMLPNNIMEKAGVPGISNLFGGAPVSRYASRNLLSTIFGPSAGMIQSAGEILGTTSPNIDWSASHGKSAQRFVPFQNIFYLNWLFNMAREGLSEVAGVPYK